MKRYLTHLLIVSSLFAGTYDDTYTPSVLTSTNEKSIVDPFMHGNFSEIKRFNALNFENTSLDSDSDDTLDSIVRTIKDYTDNGSAIKVKVIGHAREVTDDENELKAKSDTYVNIFEDMFSDSFSTKNAHETSDDYAKNITQRLEDEDIDTSLIVTEYRSAEDIGYTTATDKGIDLSNRVMVSIYVLSPIARVVGNDDDKDGVLNANDRCPQTPYGVAVNAVGCAIDSDKDGVVDSLDQCPYTPRGVQVDMKGCPLDSDGDGVLDYKDNCPDIITDLQVDSRGCPLLKELRLNFKNKSSSIPNVHYKEVEDFATFLNANPNYNAQIIGHTDSVGTKGDNMVLSFSRANSVKNALIVEGIESSRLKAIGRGELDPIQSNRTAKGRAFNRRIEVKLFK